MFKLIATVYLALNGAPVSDPLKVTNKPVFETMDACIEFKGSEKAEMALEMLKDSLATRLKPGVTSTISVNCEPAPDDGSI